MVIMKSDLQKMVSIGRNLCQCYIVLEEINNLYSEEVLNNIFMPVSCGTFYAGNLFSKVITVFYWVPRCLLKPILTALDKYQVHISFWLWYIRC